MKNGDAAYFTVDSLSAFWPGLQVLAGDVQNAIKLHLMCNSYFFCRVYFSNVYFEDYNLWKQHSGLPEVYDTNYKVATSHQYPLRPGMPLSSTITQLLIDLTEFIESTWYLYRVCALFYSVDLLLTEQFRPLVILSTSTLGNACCLILLPDPKLPVGLAEFKI